MKHLEAMLPKLLENIHLSMALDATFITGNEEIGKLNSRGAGNKNWYGAHCYTVIQNSLVFNSALVLSRLYDYGRISFHPDKRDTLSLPIFVHHIKRTDVGSILCERARTWPVDGSELVGRNIERCIEVIEQLEASSEGKQALKSLKEFRNKRLTHSLNKEFIAPRFLDLTLLRETAMEIGSKASLIVGGADWRPADFFEERVRQGKAFWPPAIKAVLASERASTSGRMKE